MEQGPVVGVGAVCGVAGELQQSCAVAARRRHLEGLVQEGHCLLGRAEGERTLTGPGKPVPSAAGDEVGLGAFG